jgi:hypothetical protein
VLAEAMLGSNAVCAVWSAAHRTLLNGSKHSPCTPIPASLWPWLCLTVPPRCCLCDPPLVPSRRQTLASMKRAQQEGDEWARIYALHITQVGCVLCI